jgi:polysaccharide pyruvyl transferase WcaK-like protein
VSNVIYFKPAVQVENIGDLLINQVEVDLLRKHGQVIVDDSSAPKWFVNEISNQETDLTLSKTSSDPLIRTLLNALLKQKFGGGAKKQYYLAIQPGHSSRSTLKRAIDSFKLNLKFHVLRLLGLKLIRIGFSIGPFDTYNALAESFASHAYSYYAVRDKESLAIAKKYSFKNPQYFPDLAWAYSPEKRAPTSESYVVISFRANSFGSEHDEEYLRPIIARVKKLLTGSGVVPSKIIICYQVLYDREASVALFESLKNEFAVELIDHKLTLKEAIDLYSNAEYTLSNRLHVLLLALKCSALAFPVVDKIDNRKITSLFTDNNLEDLILDIKEEGKSNLTRMNNVLANKAAMLSGFEKIQKENKAIIEEKLNRLFKG